MAKIELPHIQVLKDRYGKVRYYYRREGYERATLTGVPGSREFVRSYQTAGSKPIIQKTIRPKRSIRALITAYYRSPSFLELEPQTKATYRNMLDRFREEHGDGSALTIRTRHLNQIFATMVDKPGALRNLRKRLRSVFKFAVEEEWRPDNPVVATRAPKGSVRGFIPWTEDEITKFRAYWPTGSRERLAMELLLNTGVRRSDVVLLGRQHVDRGRIKLIQVKTGNPVTVPVHPDLAREIDHATGMTFLITRHGGPFTKESFSAFFTDAADKAGCADRTPHGLRKAAGRRLAEAGCSAKQIAAVLGHTSTRMAEVYTKDADRELLADSAFENLERTSAVKLIVKLSEDPDIIDE